MTRRTGLLAVWTMALVVAPAAWLAADTLVLRDGRRIQGELVAVRRGAIEFQEYRGGRGGRVMIVSRAEIQRIEFGDEYVVDDRMGRPPDRVPGERSGGMREREVMVAANVAWTDTGIDVRAGQMVSFSGRGQVSWGPNRNDEVQGERNSPPNPNRPIPNRPGASLIGKVGRGSTDYFFIGAERAPIRVRDSGRLYLGINDDYLNDNRGSWSVTVFY